MRVTIIALGTHGEVQPYIALGLGLKASGHEVRIATHDYYEAFVRGWALDFSPVEGNPRDVMESEAGLAFLAADRNPIALARRLARMAKPTLETSLADCWKACQDAQAIVFSFLGIAGYHIAEKLGVPACGAYLYPVIQARPLPPALSLTRSGLRKSYKWLSNMVVEQVFWGALRPTVNRWRREHLRLAPVRFDGPSLLLYKRRIPILYGISPLVFPKPSTWDAWHHVVGYWFLDRPRDWSPPAKLVDFLRAGSPPVYIGFGSMSSRDPQEMTELLVKALALSGRRGIVQAGWSGLSNADLPDEIFSLESAPFDWLFPQMAAVVHHGGAGTTAAGLRAGVPSVVLPFMGDQYFWGRRVFRLGAGPRPIPRRRLSADLLANAIDTAVNDADMRARAADVSERIRAEDGVGRAVELFHECLSARGA
jgi:sterol 3beta-glucosyltransferase